jgi:hypothetical protein
MIAKNTMEKGLQKQDFLRTYGTASNACQSNELHTVFRQKSPNAKHRPNTPVVPTRPLSVFAKAQLLQVRRSPRVLAAPIITHLLPVNA